MGSRISVQDRYFIAGWSPADEQKINRYTEMLVSLYGKPENEAEYNRLANVILDLIKHRENDHHSATAALGHDWLTVDPLDVKGGEDMVTFVGLNKMLKIYVGTASGTFKWVGRGTAAATPTPYSTALATETGSRQDSTTTGFQSVTGASLRVFSTYAASVASATMYQIAIFDASSSGNMGAIHDFGGSGYSHSVSVDAFSLGIIIDLVPLGDA